MIKDLYRRSARALVRRFLSLGQERGRGVSGARAAKILERVEPEYLLRATVALLKATRQGEILFDVISPGEAIIEASPSSEQEPSISKVLEALTRFGHLPISFEEEGQGFYRVYWPPPESIQRPGADPAEPVPIDPALQLELDHVRQERDQLEELVLKLRSTLEHQAQDLASSEARSRALVEDLALGVFFVSEEGTLDFVSPRMAELIGRDSELLVGQVPSTIFESAGPPSFAARLAAVQGGEESPAFDVTVPLAASATMYQVSLALFEGGPRVIGTVQRAIRPELSRRLMEAQRLEAIGRMAGALAHQINNPAASVRLNLETALQLVAELGKSVVGEGSASVSSIVTALEEALHATERIASTLADLNAFSDERHRRLTPVDVDLTIARAVRLLENRIRHVAKLELDFGCRCDVLGDESLFSQVVLNLLSNATTAVEQGPARSGTIWVRSTRVGEHVTIEVSDDGCGIDIEDFVRLRQPLVTGWKNAPATGLGLATCDRVLDIMKGRLEVAPRPGGGTTFIVTLPISATRSNRRGAEPPPPPPGVDGRPRILMIDDERAILRAFTRLLSSKYDVTTAESIDQLEEILERGDRFDLVLCDLMMPQRSIVDAYDELRIAHPWLERRLVICTGGGFSEEAKAFVRQKGLRLLDKPFSPESLDRVLSEMPGRRTDSWLA